MVGRDGLASFADLGYVHCGLDDFWQECGAGVNGSFHDVEGNPLVDTTAFPNLTAMVKHGNAGGLKVGWYMNNCKCSEKATLLDPSFVDLAMKKSVDAMVKMGFVGRSNPPPFATDNLLENTVGALCPPPPPPLPPAEVGGTPSVFSRGGSLLLSLC